MCFLNKMVVDLDAQLVQMFVVNGRNLGEIFS
jgi:hypothetical protein